MVSWFLLRLVGGGRSSTRGPLQCLQAAALQLRIPLWHCCARQLQALRKLGLRSNMRKQPTRPQSSALQFLRSPVGLVSLTFPITLDYGTPNKFCKAFMQGSRAAPAYLRVKPAPFEALHYRG